MKNHSICVIIPAYNEGMKIGRVLDEIPRQALENEGYRVDILVVDNNCSDGTGDIARSKKARVTVITLASVAAGFLSDKLNLSARRRRAE